MRKKILLFAGLLFLSAACSSDDDAPGVEAPTLVKVVDQTVTRTGPNYENAVTTYWNYFGNRLESQSDSNGNQRIYTYDNIDIANIKTYLANGNLLRTEFFVYNPDGKLNSNRIVSGSTEERHVYTHNTDNTITAQTFQSTTFGQNVLQSNTVIFLEDGEVVRTEQTFVDGGLQINEFTYDGMKKPTANIAGFDKISFAFANTRERKGNLHNMTSDTETYMAPEPVVVPRTLTYDSEDYPLTIFNNSPFSSDRYKMEFTYMNIEL